MLRSPVSPINPAASAATHKDMQQTANRTPAPTPAPHAGHAPLLMALLVFVLTLLVTFGAWSSAQRSAEAQLHEAFDYRTRDMGYAIGRRLLVYEQVLRGARGYLRGSVDLSRAEFAEYYEVLRLDQSFPGLEALAIASVIPPGALAAHEARVRAEGFPGYRVHPADGQPRTAISHIQPFNARNLRAFGFDMYSEPVRRAAMAAARDSGQAALSGKVVLVQEGGASRDAGFLMYLPVYRSGRDVETVEQRRAALVGWIYSPFRMKDLMRGVGGIAAPQLDVEIYDGDHMAPDALLYRSPGADRGETPRFSTATRMAMAGRIWTVRMASSANLEATLDHERPQMVAATGVVLGALVSMVVWLLAGSRRRALQLAQAMTLELRESHGRIAADQRRFKTILETAYDGFVAVDRQGRITDWNVQATRIFGLDAAQAIGSPAEQLLPEERRAAFRTTFDAFIRGGAGPMAGQPTETEALHASGRRVPVELAVALLPPGDVSGATVFVRDITPRREAEARELQRQQRLDEARQALARAQKLEAVGKLTGGVAHDFNNILHIISANVQLMLRAEGPPSRKRLHNVLDAVERGSKLAGQLLAFARRQPLHPSVVDVAQLLERSDSLLQRAAGDGIVLERTTEPDLWPTLVDPNQLEHVLLNLVINARDAMDGSGRIALRLANLTVDAGASPLEGEPAPGDYVVISIADEGHGMPPEVMEHAFEPFFTTKPEGKGTGLGLSMAHGFVRQSGGQIRLESAPGAGTTVTIYLPRHVAPVLPALAEPDVGTHP
ncbi:CHASE domain-containing protein [Massilia timonae]|uniref:histidine kinase n=1 Tax=Massilia timonae CCUG 45783 TaxID=883126 RepID=K9DX12_9BURK|nr:CHASE domain-containing protein [Massilia timonae]EKU83192.1 PAS domain S-box protein [Massilia timonae CCUG 45783]